MLTFNLC